MSGHRPLQPLLTAATACLIGAGLGWAGLANGSDAAGAGMGRAALPSSTADPHAVQRQPPPRSCRARGSGRFSLPDRHCTPGAIDPAVTQADIRVTICRSGYTRRVRPPESVTEREKRASMAAYGDRGSAHGYEYDHLVPLELGGARNDPRNLWPEPGATPNVKDRLERRLHTRVCGGTLSLAAAQDQIATDWVSADRLYAGRSLTPSR